MSQTFELVCHETKQVLWLGQGHDGEMTILYGTFKHLDRLRRFLGATKGKNLVLMCTDTDDGDWQSYGEFT